MKPKINLTIASNNNHKISEFKNIFEINNSICKFEIILNPQPANIEVAENGKTYCENSRLKSIEVSRIVKSFCLADDSGLEVEALNNRPGVYSNRYAIGSDEDKRIKLLNELLDIPISKRNARFVACLTLADSKSNIIFENTSYLNGYIGQTQNGHYGFGYDPIFYLKNSNLSLAQISSFHKNQISHRAQAVKKLIEFINNNLDIF